MRQWCLIFAAIALFVAGVTGQAAAQGGFTVNPYVGVFLADEGGLEEIGEAEGIDVSVDPALVAGARLGFASASSWGFEAGYGYSPVTVDLAEGGEDFGIDVTAHLYYAAVNYTIPSESRARFFLSAGAGGITLVADEELFEDAENSSSDLLVNLGGGLLWSMGDRWAIRVDAKDHIEFCKAADNEEDFSGCPLDDKALNHIEVSGGISLQLGGS